VTIEQFEEKWKCKAPRLSRLEYEDYCLRTDFYTTTQAEWHADVIALHDKEYNNED
jgi:hypothetical protein